jgi:hypothetical protein
MELRKCRRIATAIVVVLLCISFAPVTAIAQEPWRAGAKPTFLVATRNLTDPLFEQTAVAAAARLAADRRRRLAALRGYLGNDRSSYGRRAAQGSETGPGPAGFPGARAVDAESTSRRDPRRLMVCRSSGGETRVQRRPRKHVAHAGRTRRASGSKRIARRRRRTVRAAALRSSVPTAQGRRLSRWKLTT